MNYLNSGMTAFRCYHYKANKDKTVTSTSNKDYLAECMFISSSWLIRK